MRIAYALFAYGNTVRGQTTDTLVQDISWCIREGHELVYSRLDMHGIDRARNTAVKEANAAECDLLFMLDADTAMDPSGSALAALVQAMRKHPCEAVSAVVPLRHPQIGMVNVDPAQPLEVYEATKAGAALMLLDLHRLNKLGPGPWFRYVVGEDGITAKVSEDLYFCREVQRLGGKVMADWTEPTIHVDLFPIEMRQMLTAAKPPARSQ